MMLLVQVSGVCCSELAKNQHQHNIRKAGMDHAVAVATKQTIHESTSGIRPPSLA